MPLGLAVAAVLVAGIGLVVQGDRQVGRARTALRDGQSLLDQGRYREAAEACRTGEALLGGVPFAGPLRTRLTNTRVSADRAQAAADLHAFCEQVRPLYAADLLPADQAAAAAQQCRGVWSKRAEIASRLADQPTPELGARWRADLLDLGIVTAYLEGRGGTGAHDRALATLAEAEQLLGPSGVLYLERARHLRGLGRSADADEADRKAGELPPRTAWEFLAAGRARLAAGDPATAAALLDRSLELDPRSVWGNYFRGVCAMHLHQPAEAVAAFSACLALNPDSAWCLFNRGLAFDAAGRPDRATTDVEHALARDPSLAPAREFLRGRPGH
jgi:tetratricopeptide (TPR) repeat protein